jgi:hypothetical protein
MMSAAEETSVGGSFRDPSGHVFRRNGRIFRQVNQRYADDYDRLIASGLYAALSTRGLLIGHEEVAEPPDREGSYKILAPQTIPFISYPFEWAFSQLKAAALATLSIQRQAVEHGMVLKDASAYNVQFVGAAPVFIDTLSFGRWTEGTPWIAYRQFCQHFLGPLALMSATDVRLGALSRVFIDGPPLDLVSRLLPAASKFHPSLLVHLHLHSRAQAKHGGASLARRPPTGFTKRSMLGLVDHLESAISRLTYKAAGTTWADYYANTNYSEAAMSEKRSIVTQFLQASQPATVWDLGANTGAFSVLAADGAAYTLALDFDPAAVERAVRAGQAHKERRILPLVMDLSNPTGEMGWAHRERSSLADRGPADLVLALGLIHHLTLANHVPFEMTADFFRQIGRSLVIEFVPPTDSQVVGMLSRMPGAVEGYTQDGFEAAYREVFDVRAAERIAGTERTLYHMTPRRVRS